MAKEWIVTKWPESLNKSTFSMTLLKSINHSCFKFFCLNTYKHLNYCYNTIRFAIFHPRHAQFFDIWYKSITRDVKQPCLNKIIPLQGLQCNRLPFYTRYTPPNIWKEQGIRIKYQLEPGGSFFVGILRSAHTFLIKRNMPSELF